MKIAALVVALFMAISFLAVSGTQVVKTVSARTITVPDDYSTIQGAIDAANNGDTVFVKSGYYPERLLINKSISVIGEDRNRTIIDAQQTYDNVVCITDASHVTFANFTLGNNGRPEIRFSGSGFTHRDGIRIGFAADFSRIINNTVMLIPFGSGIRSQSSFTLIEGNLVLNCSSSAITIDYFNNTVINNEYANTFASISYSAGISEGNNTIEGNHLITVTSVPSPFPSPFLEQFGVILGVAIIVVVLGAALVFLVYLIKRK
jgi:hypothetical protein